MQGQGVQGNVRIEDASPGHEVSAVQELLMVHAN
jgi:hypothetical protein